MAARRSLAKRLWYGFLHVMCRVLGAVLFHIRCGGRELVPAEGAVIVLCSHQSHFDPVLIGLACDRRLNFLARESLFAFAPFRWLIQSLDAIPIDRDGVGLGGLKETLKRLKQQEMVLIFPEGRRTSDGRVATLKSGFCALAKRADVTLAPAAIVGAFDAWPRSQSLPGRAPIYIEFGPSLPPAEIAALDDGQLVAEVERRIRDCHDRATAKRNCAIGKVGA